MLGIATVATPLCCGQSKQLHTGNGIGLTADTLWTTKNVLRRQICTAATELSNYGLNTTTPVKITRAIAVLLSNVVSPRNHQSTFYSIGKAVMSPSRQLAARLLPFLGSRGYSSAARYAARAGEEVVAVSNAHKAGSTVMEVSNTQLDLC